ncbi:MAG: PorV/PorQ family protein [candidate division KSB1 bacterium]|nr:PorV/PorQ family protein [candidate division KSB1 bacterium]MDZ7345196.1 PorV/PorQ family protein [candidate division KSB1 bacterium]
MSKRYLFTMLIALAVTAEQTAFAKQPYRMGTTTANFLEIGVGGAGIAMGDAYVASARDMSAIYWNPAGLALIRNNEAMFMYQPWVVDVNTMFVGAALSFPTIGTIGLGIFGMNYGNIDVTTLEYQQGTGEQYTAYDYNFNLTYARSLVTWFSFGASAKYISSKIWHTSASALAVDLGVLVQTPFFSPTGEAEEGMKIAMSISNYGGRMRYDGIDLLFPVDMDPSADGNYQNLQAKYKMSDWELPLIFRVGMAVNPIVKRNHRLTFEVDALHPNNMSESINLGAEYTFIVPGFGNFSLRGGYKGLFLVESNYGPTFGAGVKYYLSPSRAFSIDYAYRTLGVLGNVHCTSLGVAF